MDDQNAGKIAPSTGSIRLKRLRERRRRGNARVVLVEIDARTVALLMRHGFLRDSETFEQVPEALLRVVRSLGA